MSDNAQAAENEPVRLGSQDAIDRALLAAIVEGSDDAILTKDLNGTITSWNRGAERIFGYTAAETIGRPVMMLIPADRHDEEADILARLRAGERVDHYETIRQHKNGGLLHVSLTVSPLRDDKGNIVGASKIARNISERFRAQEQQRLLLAEMQHRIKNVFAVASGLIGLCARRAETSAELAEMAQQRLQVLAEAHSLTVPTANGDGVDAAALPKLQCLLGTLLAPHTRDGDGRVSFRGDDVTLSARTMTPLALVLNELVTNAMKYGALHGEDGSIEVDCQHDRGRVLLTWKERVADARTTPPDGIGFGTQLSQIAVEHQLGGTITRQWADDGLLVTMTFGID